MSRALRIWMLCVAALAACGGAEPDADDGDSPPTANDPSSGAPGCGYDEDCAPAASTCCGCPTFALPRSADRSDACTGVPCEPTTCAPTRAFCDRGRCALACAEVACALSCTDGFAVDGMGCLACACAVPPPALPACVDSECVEVPADCCGCARGGVDTAVSRIDVDAHRASLGCTGAERCPEISVCDRAAVPHCREGRCVLGSPDSDVPNLPEDACGRPDLPACTDGKRCVLNASSAASHAGVGVCAP